MKKRLIYAVRRNQPLSQLVEMTGFEPATPCPPDMYATKLRHISMQQWYYNNFTEPLQVAR